MMFRNHMNTCIRIPNDTSISNIMTKLHEFTSLNYYAYMIYRHIDVV